MRTTLPRLALAPRSTYLPRSANSRDTTIRQTSGASDVSCTRCAHYSLLFLVLFKILIEALFCLYYSTVFCFLPLGSDLQSLVNNIVCANYRPIPSQYSSVLSELVKVMLRPDPSRRPSAEQVFEAQIGWQCVTFSFTSNSFRPSRYWGPKF